MHGKSERFGWLAACQCPSASLLLLLRLTADRSLSVSGQPTAVQSSNGNVLSPFAGEVFTLQVVGTGLGLHDRVSIVPLDIQCNGTGSAGKDGPFASFLASAGQVGSSGLSTTSQKWPGLRADRVGTFRVCWCGLPECDMDDNFSVVDHEVGTFEVNGPSAKNVECIATETCVIELAGNRLSSSAGLLILEAGECGALNPVPAAWGGMTNPKLLGGSRSGDTFLMTAFLQRREVRHEVGHRMCWAHRPNSLEDYSVDVGEFRMSPSALPIFPTCSLGHECKIRLVGTGFARSNKVLISSASACGRNGRVTLPGLVNPQQVAGDFYSFGKIMTGGVGLYILCWAHAAAAPFDWLYLLYVGSLSICGPTGVRNGLGNILLPMAAKFFDLEVHGFCLGDDDRAHVILQSDACPVSEAAEAASNDTEAWEDRILSVPDTAGDAGSTGDNSTSRLWRGLSASQAMRLRVCWCSGSSCWTRSAFNVEAGQFVVRGPVSMNAIAVADPSQRIVAGEEFNLQVNGLGLRASDRVLILQSAATCDLAASTAGPVPLSKDSQAALAGAASDGGNGDDSTSAKWSHLQINRAGSFRVCWCGGSCAAAAEFHADLGHFQMSGPRVSDVFFCIVTSSCTMELMGTGLSYTNGILLLASGNCGDSGAEVAAWTGITNPQNVTELAESGSFTVLSFGSAMSGPFEGSALACWGNAPSLDSASAADYPVHVGRFVMHGPKPLHSECKLGALCQLGAHFSHPDCGLGRACASESNQSASEDNQSVAISPLLGMSSIAIIVQPGGCALADVVSFSGIANPAPLKSSAGVYSFGVPVHGSTGVYDLCWRLGTEIGPGFAFGTLSMLGPSALMGENGTSLRPPPNTSFNLEVLGMGLRSQDRIRIVSSSVACGSGDSHLNAAELQGPLEQNPDRSGIVGITPMEELVSLVWHDLVLSAPGIFRVCWCGHGHCAAGRDFNVLAGAIVLPSAQLRMASAAVAGRDFDLELVGEHLVSSIRIRLVEDQYQCGSDVGDANLLDPAILRAPAVPGTTGDISSSLRWSGLRVDTPAKFTACWCTLDCFSNTDFAGTLGIIQVLGPAAPDSLICVVTATCIIQLVGSGHAPTNSLLLVESPLCGMPGAMVPTLGGLVNPQRSTADSPATYDLGIPMARPAEYGSSSSELTVCWASHPPRGSNRPEDYPVLIGALTILLGPEHASLQCFLGETCVLELIGTVLGPDSEVRIASADGSCTQSSEPNIVGFTNPKHLDERGSSPSEGTLGTYTFGRATSAALGVYVLCWRHGSQDLSPTSSSLEVGSLSLLGPSSVANGLGSVLHPYLGETFVLEVLGHGLRLSNRIRVFAATEFSECGQAGSTASSLLTGNVLLHQGRAGSTGDKRTSLSWHALVMQVAGFFQVCWCNQGCASDSHFNVFAGKFSLSGPLEVRARRLNHPESTAAPIAGMPFALELRGVGLMSQDRVKIVGADSTCGVAARAATTTTTMTTATTTITTVTNMTATTTTTTTTITTTNTTTITTTTTITPSHLSWLRWSPMRRNEPGHVHLCWCHAPCLGASVSYIQVGSFSILGPTFQHAVCTATLPCNIKLQGSGFSSSNGLYISHHPSCSEDLTSSDGWSGLKNPREVSRAVGSNDTYILGTAQSGVVDKVMKMCWRSHPDVGGYPVLAGDFVLHGPKMSDQIICTIGQPCVVHLNVSSHLGGSLLISSTRCTHNSPLMTTPSYSNSTEADNMFEGIHSFGFGRISGSQVSAISLQKTHWICWAAAPGPDAKVPASDHVWEAGNITFVKAAGRPSDILPTTDPSPENESIGEFMNTTSTTSLVATTTHTSTDSPNLQIVQCMIFIDAKLESIYYDHEDISNTASGNLSDASIPKNFSFMKINDRYLVVSGNGLESKSLCAGGGLQVTCSNGISSSILWEVFGSSLPIDAEHRRGDGEGWSSPCVPVDHVFPDGGPMPIWASGSQYAALRWRVGSCGVPPALTLHHPDDGKSIEEEATVMTTSSALPLCSQTRAAYHGESCQSKCPEGHWPSSPVLSCWDGQWDSENQPCVRVRCAAAPSLSEAFASVHTSVSECAGRVFEDICNIPCLDGRPGGSMKCSSVGEWIGDIPCLKLCSQTIAASHQHEEVTCLQKQPGDKCEVPCSGDFHGGLVKNCVDGIWLPLASPTCERVKTTDGSGVTFSKTPQVKPDVFDADDSHTEANAEDNAEDDESSDGAVYISILAVVLVVVLIALLGYWWLTQRRMKQQASKSEEGRGKGLKSEEIRDEQDQQDDQVHQDHQENQEDQHDLEKQVPQGDLANHANPDYLAMRAPQDTETFELDAITDPLEAGADLLAAAVEAVQEADAASNSKSHTRLSRPALIPIGEASVVDQEMLPETAPLSAALGEDTRLDLSPNSQAEMGEIREDEEDVEKDPQQLTPIKEDECDWADTLRSIRNPNDSGYLLSKPNVLESSVKPGSTPVSPSQPDPLSPSAGGNFFTIEDEDLADEPLVATISSVPRPA